MTYLKKIAVLFCVALMVSATAALCQNEANDDVPSFDGGDPTFEKHPDITSLSDLMQLVEYPKLPKKVGIEGVVTVGVLIDKEGKPVKTKVISSDNSNLNDAAVAAVMKYDGYIPAEAKGKPVACWMTIPINFKITVDDTESDLPEFGVFIPTDKEPEVSNSMDLLKLVKYPEEAKKAGIKGIVIVAVLIDKNGTPLKTKILSSANPNLNDAAVAAVMKYDGYIPAENEGKPVACWMAVPVNFILK